MTTLALSQTHMKRLEKLAKEAGRTPQALFRFVLRDGFEETERTIKAVRSRMQSGVRHEHAEAMRQLEFMLANDAKPKKAA